MYNISGEVHRHKRVVNSRKSGVGNSTPHSTGKAVKTTFFHTYRLTGKTGNRTGK